MNIGKERLEKGIYPPKIGGALPHDDYIYVLYSIAISLKRIADTMQEGKPQ